jgi:hypothetical protein
MGQKGGEGRDMVFLAASLPTLIAASCRLYFGLIADSIRRLIGPFAASLPTGVIFILLIDEQLRL